MGIRKSIAVNASLWNQGGIENRGHFRSPGKESGGVPFTGQTVSGMQRRRESGLRLSHGTWEGGCRYTAGLLPGARGRTPQRKLRGAEYRCGRCRRTGLVAMKSL